MAKLCAHCLEVDISGRWPSTVFCHDCTPAHVRDNGAIAAHKAVARAVKCGELPRPSTLTCTDCGKPACDYDHRDYGKPLDVQPVCRSCNRKRGPARPVLTFELP